MSSVARNNFAGFLPHSSDGNFVRLSPSESGSHTTTDKPADDHHPRQTYQKMPPVPLRFINKRQLPPHRWIDDPNRRMLGDFFTPRRKLLNPERLFSYHHRTAPCPRASPTGDGQWTTSKPLNPVRCHCCRHGSIWCAGYYFLDFFITCYKSYFKTAKPNLINWNQLI